jgi:uncharacterized membrane protein YkgB
MEDTKIQKINTWVANFTLPLSRFAIFLVYFWFGALKVFSENGAANPLVVALLNKTMPWFPPNDFLICFGIFEMIVGILFLIPKAEYLAFVLLVIHLVTTILPLFILPELTWQNSFVPTLEGQYIIKNILVLALAINIFKLTTSGTYQHV